MSALKPERKLYCKLYHAPRGRSDPGLTRSQGDKKSRCPGWLIDEALRIRLLEEALVDPEGGEDFLGRPKKVWTAINGFYLIGVSTNERELRYNCYPETPATSLREELDRRAQRDIEALKATEPRS